MRRHEIDPDPTDQGLLSPADEQAILARRGIGPVTPASGGGPQRVRRRVADLDELDEERRAPAAEDPRGHAETIRQLMGWDPPPAEELAARENPCPECFSRPLSACTRWVGGRRVPQPTAHPARATADATPARR